jgi:hypothetical protein
VFANAEVEETFKTARPYRRARQDGDVNTHITGMYDLYPSYYLDLFGAVGPVAAPADPALVLAPGDAGLVGPLEAPADPPVLLLRNPGALLPTEPGTP